MCCIPCVPCASCASCTSCTAARARACPRVSPTAHRVHAPSPGLWDACEPTPAVEDDSEDSYDFENDYEVNYVFANAYGHESTTEYCNLISEGKPLTYANVMSSLDKDKWLAAMHEEIEAHR